MRARTGIIVTGFAALTALAGCGGDEPPELMNLRSKNADEFAVLPTKPLDVPAGIAAAPLPAPTPGGSNRTDPTPQADAIAALGGNAGAVTRGGVPASDGALISQTGRYGREAGIRQTLAAEDEKWRRDHAGRLLERIFNVTVYFKAYEQMSLDQYAELERWRAAGARTVAAPPPPTKK